MFQTTVSCIDFLFGISLKKQETCSSKTQVASFPEDDLSSLMSTTKSILVQDCTRWTFTEEFVPDNVADNVTDAERITHSAIPIDGTVQDFEERHD